MARENGVRQACLLAGLLAVAAFVGADDIQNPRRKSSPGHPALSSSTGGCPMMPGKAHAGGWGGCNMKASWGHGCPMMQPAAKTARKDLVRDAVCQMDIPKAHAVQAAYKGKTYYFCSASCKAKFTRNPVSYLHRSAKKT